MVERVIVKNQPGVGERTEVRGPAPDGGRSQQASDVLEKGQP